MLDFSSHDNLYAEHVCPNQLYPAMTSEGRLCDSIEQSFLHAMYHPLNTLNDKYHTLAFNHAYYLCKFAQEAGADMDKFAELWRGTIGIPPSQCEIMREQMGEA